MSSDSFVHLHCHSEFSLLDGAARVKGMFEAADRLEMPAIAMTDHGNMFGAYEFHQTSGKYNAKPIIGIEAYVAPSSRHSRVQEFWSTGRRELGGDAAAEGGKDVSGGGRYTHMTMLAKNARGLRNLFRLSSLASYEGYYMKPRMDREIISEYAEGIIATTGCPSGEVQTRLRLGQFDEALAAAAAYQDIFGKENYFLELMDHGLDLERDVRQGLLDIAKKLQIPLLATNDSHYVHRDDADSHDSLLCVGVGRNKDDPKRFRFNGTGYYIRSAEEMRNLFHELPEACDNTLRVAEMIESYDEVFAEVNRMPVFDVPEGHTPESYLRFKIDEGVKKRFGENPPPEVFERIETEMSVIEPMNFSSYFLVVADICQHARDIDVPVGPGRGSATGSLVAYLTGITELDPLEHQLLFERFLNPERISPPDIDLDFDDRQRDKIIEYVTHKYGAEYTSQVNTFGTIKAKAAVKDANRILGYPFALGEKITKAMPPTVMGKDVPLSKIFDPEHDRYAEGAEFRALYESDPDVQKIVDTGKGIEGLIRGTGVHACAFILSSEPLLDVIPMHRRDKDGMIIAGFAYPQCEAMGLIKMDFLGLRNLGIMDHAMKAIKQNRGIEIKRDEIPLDDPKTYELMARGDTLGVFQLDGGPMRSLLRLMKPTRFEDIAAVLALYRPGPMAANAHINYAERKNGRQAIEPIHPELKEALDPILGTTYHLLVYQEQTMAIARQLAGFTLGGADTLRKAMGKKKKDILDKMEPSFKEGMAKNGFSKEAADKVWETMLPFGQYAFNKSHTAGYGLVSVWTAYLKANYPAEYGAALLTSVGDDKDKMALYLADSRALHIKVLPPDVNESFAEFAAVGDDIRFGLAAVRNVGHNVVDGIVHAREEHGAFTDFYDFLDKVPLVVCNKRVIESLIKAGAFDSMGHTRRSLMEIFESAVDQVLDLKRNEALGQDDLFGAEPAEVRMTGSVPEMADWDKRTKLAFEREMLGLYVSDHPLSGLEHVLAGARDLSIPQLLSDDGPRDTAVTICGMITGIQRKQNKKGETWAIVTVEDLEASVDVMCFSKAYQAAAGFLAQDTIVTIKGRVRERDDSVELSAMDISMPQITEGPSGPLVITLPVTRCIPAVVDELKTVLSQYPGGNEVQIHLTGPGETVRMRVADTLRVAPSQPLFADLKALLGPACLSV